MTIYEKVDLKDPMSLITVVGNVVEKISELKSEEEIGEIYKMFKNKRERIIYKLGLHAASEQLFLLLLLEDVSPIFFKTYQKFHHLQLQRYLKLAS